jgi:plastocyanin
LRRIFALLLVTPLLANCSDSGMPVAPEGAVLTQDAVPTEGAVPTEVVWPTEENWWTPGDVLAMEGNPFANEASPLQGAPTSGEVMVFGNPDAGQIFPGPPGSHDASWHGRDRIIPGTVVINAGQTVTFQVIFGHRVAIYNDGMRPADIQPTPGPLLLYPVNRLFLQPFPTPQFTLTFVRPGKYLVVCAINAHFYDANMWGWVIVR